MSACARRNDSKRSSSHPSAPIRAHDDSRLEVLCVQVEVREASKPLIIIIQRFRDDVFTPGRTAPNRAELREGDAQAAEGAVKLLDGGSGG